MPSAGTPSILKRAEVQAASEALTVNETYAAIAKHYNELAQSDSDSAQAWTICSAVAFKRSLSDGEGFSRCASQMAETLKPIAADSTNPCSDAIPDSFWYFDVTLEPGERWALPLQIGAAAGGNRICDTECYLVLAPGLAMRVVREQFCTLVGVFRA